MANCFFFCFFFVFPLQLLSMNEKHGIIKGQKIYEYIQLGG